MDFTMSDRQREWLDRVTAFMDTHVRPAVPIYKQQDAEGDRWKVIPILEDLKKKKPPELLAGAEEQGGEGAAQRRRQERRGASRQKRAAAEQASGGAGLLAQLRHKAGDIAVFVACAVHDRSSCSILT